MSKFIRITPEQIDSAVEEFRAALTGSRLLDGKISYTKKFEAAGERATVRFTVLAWAKMERLLDAFDKEVAWHGVCERVAGEKNTYLISDIMVYPQVVTGGSVKMDETEYAKWLQDNGEDDRFYKINFQGHSHVYMATNPSGVDLEHQASIVNQLKKNGFYLFAIYNKRMSNTWFIYDMESNLFFENKDITVELEGDPNGFIADAKKMVKEPSTVIGAAQSGKSMSSVAGITTTPASQTGSAKPASQTYQPYDPLHRSGFADRPKTVIGAGWHGKDTIEGQKTIGLYDYNSYGDDDYYDCYGDYSGAYSPNGHSDR